MARTAWPTVMSGDAWLFGQHNQFGRDNDLAYWKGVAAGDTEYYDSATTRARIPIGTAGQELAVNAGATAPEWVTGGTKTLIESFTAAGGETSYTFSAIPQTYRHLKLIINGRVIKVGTSNIYLVAQINADAGANYGLNWIQIFNNAFGQAYTGVSTYLLLGYIQSSTATANYSNVIEALIPNYANATFYKVSQSINSLLISADLANSYDHITHSVWRNTAPITSLKIWMINVLYSFAANTKISLYGLK